MRIRIAVPEEHVHPDVINAALESVTRVNEHMLRAGQTPTSHELIRGGAIWRPENMGDEHFDHGATIAARGWGDCDDWAPIHAATLRASGEDPGAAAHVVPSGPSTYHAIVHRSDGSIDDPSIAAGMKPNRVGRVDGESLSIWACDPHDGRIYQGQLAPTTSPLTIRCSGLGLRSAHIVGQGTVYEARCDLPIVGSPLMHVRSYWRHKPRHHHRVTGVSVVGGQVPYAWSVTSQARHPAVALNNAIVGAILCGDASEMGLSVDRYKLLAMQGALAGLTPGQVREALIQQVTADVHAHAAATGTDPAEHAGQLRADLAAQGGVGCDGGYIVGDVFSDIGHFASDVVSTVSDAAGSIAKAVSSVPWGDIIHTVQAAVSVVPVLGTAVSNVIAAAESAYDVAAAALSGDPLGGAIHAAYNFALASVPAGPAFHLILDPVVNTLLNLIIKKEPIETAVLDGLLSDIPDVPKFGAVSPRTIAASLAHMIVGHLGAKNTGSAPGRPGTAVFPGSVSFMQQIAQQVAARTAQAAAAPVLTPAGKASRAAYTARRQAGMPVPTAPAGVPHAAIHMNLAHLAPTVPAIAPTPAMPDVMAAEIPAAAAAASSALRSALRPGSPGAPPGASHWTCSPGPGGSWQCRWA